MFKKLNTKGEIHVILMAAAVVLPIMFSVVTGNYQKLGDENPPVLKQDRNNASEWYKADWLRP